MLINGKIRNHWGPPYPWTFMDKTGDGKSNEWCKCDVVTGECSCFVVCHRQQLHLYTLIRVLSYLFRYIISPKRFICSLCSTFHYIGYNVSRSDFAKQIKPLKIFLCSVRHVLHVGQISHQGGIARAEIYIDPVRSAVQIWKSTLCKLNLM